MIDFEHFRLLTFDCYGTLIDWETGIFSALHPMLRAHNIRLSDLEILELYAEFESSAELGEFKPYWQVLRSVVVEFGNRLGFAPTEAELDALSNSMAYWEPFHDTVEALLQLKSKYQLAVISNVDDSLFSLSAPKLRVAFDHVVTAEQARCYKPNLKIFKLALQRTGIVPKNILHVGQSIYHDVLPAQSLGIATVWVNRPSPRPNGGAAKSAKGKPDLEIPDLKSLADRAISD